MIGVNQVAHERPETSHDSVILEISQAARSLDRTPLLIACSPDIVLRNFAGVSISRRISGGAEAQAAGSKNHKS